MSVCVLGLKIYDTNLSSVPFATFFFFFFANSNKATVVEVRYGSTDINGGTSVTASRFIDHPQYNRNTQVSVIIILKLGHKRQCKIHAYRICFVIIPG